MKTTSKWWLLAFAVIAMLGCKSGGSKVADLDVDDPTLSGETELLTADQQKDYLVQVGKEVINIFNTKDLSDVTELANGLYDKYCEYEVEEMFEEAAEDVASRYESYFETPKRLAAIASGHATPSVAEMLILSFADDSYTFTLDENSRRIIVTESADKACHIYFTDKFGAKCEVKVWGEGSEKTYTYSYVSRSQEVTRGVKLPETIKMYLRQGSKELISYTFHFDTDEKKEVNSSCEFKVTNISVMYDAHVCTECAKAAYILKYGDVNVIAASANLPKYQLIEKTDKQDWDEWAELYEKRYESIIGSCGSGEALVNIIGKVQLKGIVSDGSGLYDAIKAWNDKYDKYYGGNNWWEAPYYTLQAQEELCKAVDNYVSVALHFSSATKQALVRMEPVSKQRYTYNYDMQDYQDVTIYEVEPVLYFPKDETSYAIETFFGASKFSILVDLAEDLINQYADLVDDEIVEIEHIEL